MYYTRIHIQNYKSFLNTGEIRISKGINLIIGQNNVGKTALLELLSGLSYSKPHLNAKQKPRAGSKIENSSFSAQLELLISSQELEHLIEDKSFDNTFVFHNKLIEYPNLGYVTQTEYTYDYDVIVDQYEYEELMMEYGNNSLIDVNIENLLHYLEGIVENDLLINYYLPNKTSIISNYYDISHSISSLSSNIAAICFRQKKQEFELREISSQYEISQIICKEFFENRIYKFDIHRTVYSGKLGINTNKLEANCTNLSSVLDSLQANPNKLKEYQELVTEVFPKIKNVSIDKLSESAIRIWMPQSDNRPDLTIPLEDCGTGVGQVLAMLYVIVSSEEPRVIIIDEPNSFLHPSASRKLVEIFKRYNQHQYIISTHSPELITAADADQILLLTLNEQGQTQVREIDKKDANGMRDILENIGSKLSDVFGYESILWVEGETEESCFPLIIEKLLKKSLTQQAILKVKETGSFEKNQIQTTLNLYNRLVNGNALIPPATAFIFDKENRSLKDLEDMRREGKGKLHFLKRRLYENYLLNSGAITSILNKYSMEYEWDRVFTENEINIFLHDKKEKKKYWDNRKPNSTNLLNWITEIQAAFLLGDLFNHFSETQLKYKKTTQSKELTEWLIENAPHELDELKELLSQFYK